MAPSGVDMFDAANVFLLFLPHVKLCGRVNVASCFSKAESLTLLYASLVAPLLDGTAVIGVGMDLQLVHHTKGGNITSHQSRIRNYFCCCRCLSPV